MQFKSLLQLSLLAVSIAGLGLSAIAVFSLTFYRPNQSYFTGPASPTLTQAQNLLLGDTSTLPVRLKIPKIDLNAAVEYVGLTPEGAMDVPQDPADVAWFKPGQRPGENGSAVIAGHYGWARKQKISAFDHLNKLRPGDKLFVENAQGITVSFVVSETRSYEPNDSAPEVFSSDDGKSHLNLVTCEGEWNKDSKSYPKRLVVFAEKE